MGLGQLWVGEGRTQEPELRPLCSPYPHSCPEPAPQTPRLQVSLSGNLYAGQFSLYAHSWGQRQPKLCLGLRRKKNVHLGSSWDILPGAKQCPDTSDSIGIASGATSPACEVPCSATPLSIP